MLYEQRILIVPLPIFILDKIKLKNKRICSKEEIIPYLKDQQLEVLLTMGAGDIDKLVQPIKENLDSKK